MAGCPPVCEHTLNICTSYRIVRFRTSSYVQFITLRGHAAKPGETVPRCVTTTCDSAVRRIGYTVLFTVDMGLSAHIDLARLACHKPRLFLSLGDTSITTEASWSHNDGVKMMSFQRYIDILTSKQSYCSIPQTHVTIFRLPFFNRIGVIMKC